MIQWNRHKALQASWQAQCLALRLLLAPGLACCNHFWRVLQQSNLDVYWHYLALDLIAHLNPFLFVPFLQHMKYARKAPTKLMFEFRG